MPKDRKRDISISKDVLPQLPAEYVETSLGDMRGAKNQFRSKSTKVHVREYADRFTIHVDRENPLINPVGHLLRDAPETVAALAGSLLVARDKIRRKGSTVPAESRRSFEGLNPLTLVGAFILLSGMLRFLKDLFFG